jgi:hypothetical protein
MLNLRNITLDDLKSIDFDSTIPNVTYYQGYYEQPAGENHYRLFAYLSTLLPDDSLIVDVGTRHGTSAFAFSFNPKVNVITYNLEQEPVGLINVPPNIDFRIGDVMYDKEVLNASLISIDTAHLGNWELEFFDWLVENNWHGITVWDDTIMNTIYPHSMEPGQHPMRDIFLQGVIERGYELIDLTPIGHITGTTAIIL